MEILVLHLILFLGEVLANFILKSWIAPVAISITCLSKLSLCLIRVVFCCTLQICVFSFIYSLELEFLGVGCLICIFRWWLPFAAWLSSCHHSLGIRRLFPILLWWTLFARLWFHFLCCRAIWLVWLYWLSWNVRVCSLSLFGWFLIRWVILLDIVFFIKLGQHIFVVF